MTDLESIKVDIEEEEKEVENFGRKEKEIKKTSFECNICLETANTPIVTQCGHLYCWECIHAWLGQNKATLICPVCKAGISEETMVPLYTRGEEGMNSELPKRPVPDRLDPVPNNRLNVSGPGGVNLAQYTMGYGVFPGIFLLNFTGGTIQNNDNPFEYKLKKEFTVMSLLIAATFLVIYFIMG